MNRETDALVSQYVLNNTVQDMNGRLVMPLLWRSEVAHLQGSNYNLSKKVLKSNLKRLQGHPERLKMYDEVIREQAEIGIIDRIENLSQFLEEIPSVSFLPHMGVE